MNEKQCFFQDVQDELGLVEVNILFSLNFEEDEEC